MIERLNFGLQTAAARARTFAEDLGIEAYYRSGREYTDLELLERIDPYLADTLGEGLFYQLQYLLHDGTRTVVDIGAGSNPMRDVVFGASKVICVDPGYQHYQYRVPRGFSQPDPYPPSVAGGTRQKYELIKNLKQGCKGLEMPRRIEGTLPLTIHGKRFGQPVTFQLVPQAIEDWIKQQTPESLENIVAWGIFMPAEIWGQILACLKTGGVLITTGYGVTEDGATDFKTIGGGVDVDNSPLPRNGNCHDLGLQPLINSGKIPEIYFYRKLHHRSARQAAEILEKNL